MKIDFFTVYWFAFSIIFFVFAIIAACHGEIDRALADIGIGLACGARYEIKILQHKIEEHDK